MGLGGGWLTDQRSASLASRNLIHEMTSNRHLSTYAEIGLGLTAFGVMFVILGMILFFDRGLIAMGNVSCHLRSSCLETSWLLMSSSCHVDILPTSMQLLFLAGLSTTIGFHSTVQFFTRRKNRKASIVCITPRKQVIEVSLLSTSPLVQNHASRNTPEKGRTFL